MLGYESAVVNGQLVNVAPKQGFDPLTFGQAYTGPGMWPRQGVYNVPPVLASAGLQSSMAPAAMGQGPGNMPNGNQVPTALSEAGSPFHPTKSPLRWALGFLVIGLLMLQYIHFK